MQFQPLTEEELQIASLIPEGVYDYQVMKAEDKISKAGNEYTAIDLMVWDNNAKSYLVFTNMALTKLLKHFCDVNNMQEQYKSGNIPAMEFMNKAGGQVVIGIEGEKANPNGGTYKAKNIVKDYVVDLPGSMMKPLPEIKNELNDDIPF
jgi:hypothetical protein